VTQELRSVSRARPTGVGVRRRRGALQRALPAAVVGLGVLGMPALLVASGGVTRLQSLELEREAVQLEISRVSKRVEHLRAAAREIEREPAAVERSARDQLGLVRRSEVVFQFESPPGGPPSVSSSR
jgi:cell division protein FtsB